MPSPMSLRHQPVQPLDNPVRQALARSSQRSLTRRPDVTAVNRSADDSLDSQLAHTLRQQDALERLHERLLDPAKQWHIGVTRLSLGPDADDATTRHLKHLAKGSALFDQFCVGLSVDTTSQRLYLAFRLVDLSGMAQLPDEDTLSDVFCELAYHCPESSLYVFMEHADGTLTWCDFGAEPVALEAPDMQACAELLQEHPDGVVVAFSYKLCFSLRADTLDDLREAVGVKVDGEVRTRHELTAPHRSVPLNELTLEVGNYYRALQNGRVVSFAKGSRVAKRRAAEKAKRKQQKKARRK